MKLYRSYYDSTNFCFEAYAIKKDQTMKNFCVTAKETIYYTKFIECEDEETLKKYIQSGDVLFDYDDIKTDGDNFELCDIEEMSFVNS